MKKNPFSWNRFPYYKYHLLNLRFRFLIPSLNPKVLNPRREFKIRYESKEEKIHIGDRRYLVLILCFGNRGGGIIN